MAFTSPAGADSRQPQQILVVEDDRDLRRLLARVLQAHGYRVHTAADGMAALDRIACEAPDLLLTDLTMPRLNGSDLIARLRKIDAAIPIVVLTAIDDARVAPGVAVLVKPCNLDRLLQVVAARLEPGSGTKEAMALG